MLEKYKTAIQEYEKAKTQFIDILEIKIIKIGPYILSRKMGFSGSYITKALKRRTGSRKFWIDLCVKVDEIIEGEGNEKD